MSETLTQWLGFGGNIGTWLGTLVVAPIAERFFERRFKLVLLVCHPPLEVNQSSSVRHVLQCTRGLFLGGVLLTETAPPRRSCCLQRSWSSSGSTRSPSPSATPQLSSHLQGLLFSYCSVRRPPSWARRRLCSSSSARK